MSKSKKTPTALEVANTAGFEAGRQDVLTDLEKHYQRELAFLDRIRDNSEGMSFSIEQRNGIYFAYKNLLDRIAILKKQAEDSKKEGEIF